MNIGQLGRVYDDGAVIFRQGDEANSLFVVQHGSVELLQRDPNGRDVKVASLLPGDLFGETALFHRAPRTMSAVTRGQSRILTLSCETFLQRLHEDPSLGYQGLKHLSEYIDRLHRDIVRLRLEADARR